MSISYRYACITDLLNHTVSHASVLLVSRKECPCAGGIPSGTLFPRRRVIYSAGSASSSAICASFLSAQPFIPGSGS